ncbi:MAG TPA: DUF998 domain-containing protein [Symbiobacteriaceae bacterium]|nr:DUF998 domain-containing protein [Symbiobacteriaceae bacterium]
MKKLLLICGILAPLTYLTTVLYGAAITPGYSHVAHAISELVMDGAPLRWKIDPGFIIYNLFLLLAGVGLVWEWRGAGKHGLAPVGWMLMATALLSDLMYFFPQDPRTATPTFAGTMHLVLAGMTALLTIVMQVVGGIRFRRIAGLESLSLYSFVSAAWVLVTGGLSVTAVTTGSPYLGLVERCTIGGFEVWVLVFATALVTRYLPRRAAV